MVVTVAAVGGLSAAGSDPVELKPDTLVSLAAPVSLAEDWPGYEGGGAHHNASSTDVRPAGLTVTWQRRFDAVRTGRNLTIGSRNLAVRDGKVALIAAAGKGFPSDSPKKSWHTGYITILDVQTGRTVNCIRTPMRDGQRHNAWYPTCLYVDAADTLGGQHVLHWDTESGVLFVRSGGDGCFAAAWKPLENLAAYDGGFQDGVPAFAKGRSIPQWNMPAKELDAHSWEPTGPNNTSFFEVDSRSPLIAVAFISGHTQAGNLRFADKRSGLPVEAQYTAEIFPVAEPPYTSEAGAHSLRPFAKWAPLIVSERRLFFMAPGDDNDADGNLGNAQLCVDNIRSRDEEMAKDQPGVGSRRWQADNPDQGLHLAAYDFAFADGDPPSVKLAPAFVYRFVSPHVPTQGPADCESFLETDHFRRNKALLADGKGIWAVWQTSKAVGAELIHADKDGFETWPLGVCRGVRGQDVWPHLSLADTDTGKRIVYYAGNAYRREYIDKDPPYRPIKCFSGPVREYYASVVLEDGELDPPGCPAQLAVFDVSNRQVAWTYDISPNNPSLPPNLDQHYIDRSQMVVAGKWAFIGWLDLHGSDAKLRLLGFDVTTPKPEPIENVFPLGFPAENFPNSILTDLIAADGQLYALVTQAATMAPNHRVFDAQHVLALANR